METELKFSIPDKKTADSIWDNALQSDAADISTAEKLVMKAVYFDTEDGTLSENNIALRVRTEGNRSFATVKWGGTAKEGFHEREEVNVPVSGEKSFIAPDAGMFKESAAGADLIKLIGDKPLVNMLETRFLRRRMRLNCSFGIVELAIDTGEIVTDAGNGDILELELELFAGNAEELKKMGKTFAEKFGLAPENRSKYARGLEILGKERK